MPSQRKSISKQVLNERRKTLVRLLEQSALNANLDEFSDFFRVQVRQLITTPKGSAKARLLRHIARRSCEADWAKVTELAEIVDHRRLRRVEDETEILSIRDSLIDGYLEPSAIFGDRLTDVESQQLKTNIEDARR